MATLDAHVRAVDEPDELLVTTSALLGRVVMAAAYHSAHPQFSHLTLDLTAHVDHHTATQGKLFFYTAFV